MAKLIDRVSKQLQAGGLNLRTKKARDWLQREVAKASFAPNIRGASILKDDTRKVDRVLPGRLYFYVYDPKTKATLPYYDKFPLVLPIEPYSDGFLGLNFHYIRPKDRLLLMDKLYETLTNTKFDEKTKLRVNYDLLSNAARFGAYKPCVKRYLNSHIRSSIIEIGVNDWEVALMLPVDNFVGATSKQVHRESGAMY